MELPRESKKTKENGQNKKKNKAKKRKEKQAKKNNNIIAMWQIECSFAMTIIVANGKFDGHWQLKG